MFSQKKSHSPEKEKVPAAISYIHGLHCAPKTFALKKFLASYEKPKTIDPATFTEGIKKFIYIANLSSSERQQFYGDTLGGLQYSTSLKAAWNQNHSEKITAEQLCSIAPFEWSSVIQDGFNVLIYKGQEPAKALDKLLQGPTAIDCGIFCQLSLWFGLRYMLGDERFNQIFGQAPFFITQTLYNKNEHSNTPYIGNPLYAFISEVGQASIPGARIEHVPSTEWYLFKHPGNSFGGENTIVCDETYYVFNTDTQLNQGVTKSLIEEFLRNKFNDPQNDNDKDRLVLYDKQPGKIHKALGHSYRDLRNYAESLKDNTLTEEAFRLSPRINVNPLVFDLGKVLKFLKQFEESQQIKPQPYQPLDLENVKLPKELIDNIPFENKNTMSFATFEQKTQQQQELMKMSQQFCQSVMNHQANLVILSGKAGVGKTAAAVCAAKELAAQGKRVLWISEVMVKSWAEQATSIEDVIKCEEDIAKLLANNPDAIFLDDDNLIGYFGNMLLEKMYSWYIAHEGKGLFITSNINITFEHCYGYKIDGRYHYPPFTDYTSQQFLNKHIKTNLDGVSLRQQHSEGQSVGAIVSPEEFEAGKNNLAMFELIPCIDYDQLLLIRQSLANKNMRGEAYSKLRPIEKAWLRQSTGGGFFKISGHGRGEYELIHQIINPKPFEKTIHKTIVLEIGEFHNICDHKTKVSLNSIKYLLQTLNYVHDKGNMRLILLNKTSFTHEVLLEKIKQQLTENEKERTLSRLNCLLCETASSIFYPEKIEESAAIPAIFAVKKEKSHLSTFQTALLNRLHTMFTDSGCKKELEKSYGKSHQRLLRYTPQGVVDVD